MPQPTVPPDILPHTLDNMLCFSLYAAQNAMHRLYGPYLQEIGLTYPQYLVMVVLWEQDGCLVGDIGRQLFLESSTLTPLLKRLEAKGLVIRQRDQNDERQVRIHLTAEGHALATPAQCMRDSLIAHLRAENADIDALRRLQSDLNKLRTILQAD